MPCSMQDGASPVLVRRWLRRCSRNMTPSLSAATARIAGRCRRSCRQLVPSRPRADALGCSPVPTLRRHPVTLHILHDHDKNIRCVICDTASAGAAADWALYLQDGWQAGQSIDSTCCCPVWRAEALQQRPVRRLMLCLQAPQADPPTHLRWLLSATAVAADLWVID